MIHAQRMTAQLPGDFVVFLIGMRINKPWLLHKWWPVATAMPRLLKELNQQPERGLLHAELWFGRTILCVQYWRSMEQLMSYARDRQSQHLPAWAAFNKAIGTDGTVGIWHETYAVREGGHESIYVNMPRFGLAQAGDLQAVGRHNSSAAQRLSASGVQS